MNLEADDAEVGVSSAFVGRFFIIEIAEIIVVEIAVAALYQKQAYGFGFCIACDNARDDTRGKCDRKRNSDEFFHTNLLMPFTRAAEGRVTGVKER